ncbi:MAG: hypothetical protein AAGI68_08360 [Planctomycetota bacterium]
MTDPNTLPPPPHNSAMTGELSDGQPSVQLPARGMLRGAFGMTFLGVFIMLLCGGSLALTLWGVIVEGEPLGDYAVALAGAGVMLAAGVLVFLYAVMLGTERARLDLLPDTLLITRQNKLRLKQHEITRRNLIGVSTSSSNPTRYNQYTKCLAISRADARDLELFTNRTEDDLAYLATLIKDRYNLGLSDDSDWDDDEEDSDWDDDSQTS